MIDRDILGVPVSSIHRKAVQLMIPRYVRKHTVRRHAMIMCCIAIDKLSHVANTSCEETSSDVVIFIKPDILR
jgi:hypothetical protein